MKNKNSDFIVPEVWAEKVREDLLNPSPFLKFIEGEFVKPNRLQILKERINLFFYRLKRAWDVLRGIDD